MIMYKGKVKDISLYFQFLKDLYGNMTVKEMNNLCRQIRQIKKNC